nr:MAG TPA: RecT protein [Caudoviricetes sp.]
MDEIIDINQAEIRQIPTQTQTQLASHTDTGIISDFRQYFKMASELCKADIIPQAYKGKVADTAIAIDMANRMGVSPMMVMQSMYVVKGKPSWSGQACLSFIRAKFTDVKVIYVGAKGTDDRGCYVKATDKDGDVLEGTTVTMSMAKAEGWTSNSKWRNMPEQMLAYRAASFFARVHCPETLMGVQVEGEVEDSSKPAVREVEDVL